MAEKEKDSVKVYIEAYACDDDGDGPEFAVLNVDLAFCAKLLHLRQQCIDNRLSELRVYDAPDKWGPGDIGEELRLTCAELVVTPASFWFTDNPKHANYSIETRLQYIDDFFAQLKTCGNEAKQGGDITPLGLEGESSVNGGALFMGDDVEELQERVEDDLLEREGELHSSENEDGGAPRPVFIRCEESNVGMLKGFGMDVGDYDLRRGGVLATGPVSVLGKLADFPQDFRMEYAKAEGPEVSWAGSADAARPLTSMSAVSQIKVLLEQADTLWKGLPPEERDRLISLHNYEGSIDYCLRYGMTACEETLEVLREQGSSPAPTF